MNYWVIFRLLVLAGYTAGKLERYGWWGNRPQVLRYLAV